MPKVKVHQRKFTAGHIPLQFYLGFEYYLAARITFPLQLVASAVLFHHAIERFLLSELIPGKSEIDLKKLYGKHSLERHWADFKSSKQLPNKHKLDKIVKSFETFDLRFLRQDKSLIRFRLDRTNITKTNKDGDERADRNYIIVLEDADYFFKTIVEILNIEPKFILGMLLHPRARLSAYLDGNKHTVITAGIVSKLQSPMGRVKYRKNSQDNIGVEVLK